MKVFTGIIFVLSSAVSLGSWAADYGKASKIASARQGDIVVRYVKEYESPCLIIQILDPKKNWSVITEKSFCSYDKKSLLTDVSYAAFDKISFSPEGVNATLEISPLELTEDEVYTCVIPIKKAVIESLKCNKN